jgi:hypothetical protein
MVLRSVPPGALLWPAHQRTQWFDRLVRLPECLLALLWHDVGTMLAVVCRSVARIALIYRILPLPCLHRPQGHASGAKVHVGCSFEKKWFQTVFPVW